MPRKYDNTTNMVACTQSSKTLRKKGAKKQKSDAGNTMADYCKKRRQDTTREHGAKASYGDVPKRKPKKK